MKFLYIAFISIILFEANKPIKEAVIYNKVGVFCNSTVNYNRVFKSLDSTNASSRGLDESEINILESILKNSKKRRLHHRKNCGRRFFIKLSYDGYNPSWLAIIGSDSLQQFNIIDFYYRKEYIAKDSTDIKWLEDLYDKINPKDTMSFVYDL